MLSSRLSDSNFEILVHGEVGELHGADAWDDILYRPCVSQDIEELETGRANIDAIGNGIRGFCPVACSKEPGIKEVSMVGCVGQQDLIEIERFARALTLKPFLVKILFQRIRIIPLTGSQLLKVLRLRQLMDFIISWETVRLEARFRYCNWSLRINHAERVPACHEGLAGLV